MNMREKMAIFLPKNVLRTYFPKLAAGFLADTDARRILVETRAKIGQLRAFP